jgi:FkbM family methyltransferase
MTLAELIYTVLLKPAPLRAAANALIKAALPATVRIGGAVVWLNPQDPVVSGALALRVYERCEMAFFRDHFRGSMTFIDVGANVGLYTAIALSKKGDGAILAIEPHRESRSFLHNTILTNAAGRPANSVQVCELAASDRRGTLSLYKNSQNKGDNRIYPDPLLDEQETVSTDTLDNICAARGMASVDFLKIDVQGAEAKVIAGAAQLLQNSADCILMTEFWPYGLARSGSDALDYLESLGEFGFALYELGGRRQGIVPLEDPRALIARTQGRSYANLIGVKGKNVLR